MAETISNTEHRIEDDIIIERIDKVAGESVERTYRKGKFLGKGGFARVYEFVNTETDKIYACKIVPKDSLKKTRAKQKLMSEIKIHRSL